MAVNTDSIVSNLYSTYSTQSKTGKTNKENVTGTENSKVSKTNGNYGKTIGNAKLSEEGAKYYQELKKKYSNMDFILVSKDQKANAQANAASYANGNKMVVLIDEEKIERMATDENYRKQYEGIIKNAASGLSQLKSQIESSGQSQNVVGYGMKVNDGGTASFFAVLKKSSADQKARIEKKAVEKTEAELQVGQHIDFRGQKSLYIVQKGFRKYRKSFLCTGKLGSHYKKRSVGMHDIQFAHRNDL